MASPVHRSDAQENGITTEMPQKRPLRVYLSSTRLDLRQYRQAVLQTIHKHRERFTVHCSEDYLSESRRPLAKCLEDVRNCDVYVGVFAFRYGECPPESEQSFTEQEFREAVKHKKTILIFLADPEADIPPVHVDSGVNRRRIDALREELRREYLTGSDTGFKNPDDLAGKVLGALIPLLGQSEVPADDPGNRPVRRSFAWLRRWLLPVVVLLGLFIAGWWYLAGVPQSTEIRWFGLDALARTGLPDRAPRLFQAEFADPHQQVLSPLDRQELDVARRQTGFSPEQADVTIYLSNRCRLGRRPWKLSWPADWQVRVRAYQLEGTAENLQRVDFCWQGTSGITFAPADAGGEGQPRWFVLFLFPVDAPTAQAIRWHSSQIQLK